MPGDRAGAELLAEIFPGHADTSADIILHGWGPPEDSHRWTVGAESHMRLPVKTPGPDSVLLVELKPWSDPGALPEQTVMLAVNGRLVTTLRSADQRALAVRLPANLPTGDETILSFTQLSSRLPRPLAGTDHAGLPLGFMVLSVRLFRLADLATEPQSFGALPGTIADGRLAEQVRRGTGLSAESLAGHFECLGHNCEFGLVQRAFGTEPLSLLRFAGMTSPALVRGLMQGFAGIGEMDALRIFVVGGAKPEFGIHEQLYDLWYNTGYSPSEKTREEVLRAQHRKLARLQRKFVEDLHDGDKIYVLTRGEIMSEAEALAIFCALNRHNPKTLLYTVHGDANQAGRVDRLMPGLLRGHLGLLDPVHEYASYDAWLSVLTNAYRLMRT